MTGLVLQGRSGRRWLVTTPARAAVVALSLASVAVSLGCLLLTTHRGPAWPAVVVVVLALVTTILPDSWAALVTLLAYGTWWLVAVQDPTTPWALPAALGLLTFHATVSHGAVGPPRIAGERATLRRWWRDCAVVAVPTALAAVMVTVAHDPSSTPRLVVGVTLLLVALLLWVTREHSPGTTE